MKKTVSLILCIIVFVSMCVSNVFAENTHWAYGAASELIEKGIVSGYSDGTLKLDNCITRAEFVKIINHSLNFTEKSDTVFPDVSYDKWYYDEMLIAKKCGYITGDEMGNARPEANITRAEASVVLARILELDIKKTEAPISDIDEIPEWAKGSVIALFNKEIIKGYEDGSFRYNNNLTRGEAFYIVDKTLSSYSDNNQDENIAESEEEQPNVSVKRSPVGGGGGGGGTSTPLITVAATPNLKNNPDVGKYLIAWNPCTGAKDYNIKISLENEEDYIINYYNGTSIDLYSTFAAMAVNRNNSSEKFTVSVMSNGLYNVSDSPYSTPMEITAAFESIDAPVLKSRNGLAGGIHRVIFDWEPVENAIGYDVSITMSDGTQLIMGTDYTYDENALKVVIPDTSVCDNETKISLIAQSGSELYKDSIIVEQIIPTFTAQSDVEQNGSREYPWIITSEEQFEAIGVADNQYGYKLSHHYVVTNNITITQPIGTDSNKFSGSITGKLNGTEYKPTITFNVGSSDSPLEYTGSTFGMVATLDKNGKISNFNFDGGIYITKDNDLKTGAAAGNIREGAVIEKCTNYAVISSSGYVGGIAGNSEKSNTFSDCANYAELTTTGSYIGGIAGKGIGTFERCFNEGKIKGYRYSAGIAGDGSYSTVTLCSNAGDIYATDQVAAGIMGWSTSGSDVTISKSFNTGNIYAPEGKIAGLASGKTTISKSCTYTISDFYNNGLIYDAVYDSDGEVISASERINPSLIYEVGKKDTPLNFVANRVYSTIPCANYNSEANMASCSYNNVYYLGEWKGDSSFVSTAKLGASIDEAALESLPETDSSFTEDIWFTDSSSEYKYPQLKSNTHIKTKEVIPSLKNYSVTSIPDNGSYDIEYSWSLPDGIKGLKVKVVNNTEIINATGTGEDGWITLDYEGVNAGGFTLEGATEDCYYEIFIKIILSDDENGYYLENYEHLIPIV